MLATPKVRSEKIVYTIFADHTLWRADHRSSFKNSSALFSAELFFAIYTESAAMPAAADIRIIPCCGNDISRHSTGSGKAPSLHRPDRRYG